MSDFPDEITPVILVADVDAVQGYAALTGDWNPIHVDPAFAADTPFGRPIAHGTMALNLLLEAVARMAGGRLRVADLDVRFAAPTFVGRVLSARASRREGARYDVEVATDDGTVVVIGEATLAPRASA